MCPLMIMSDWACSTFHITQWTLSSISNSKRNVLRTSVKILNSSDFHCHFHIHFSISCNFTLSMRKEFKYLQHVVSETLTVLFSTYHWGFLNNVKFYTNFLNLTFTSRTHRTYRADSSCPFLTSIST